MDQLNEGELAIEGTDDEGVTEHAFICPYCWEQVTILVDTSIPEQEYVEDCEVCCNPIAIRVVARGALVRDFDAQRLP